MVELTSDISWEIPQCLVLAIGQIEQLLPSKGIYRINGNALDVQLLKQQMENNDFKALQKCHNINTIASAIKLYIRELPQPLMSTGLAMNLVQIVKNLNFEGKHNEVAKLIKSEMSYGNMKILKYLLEHLNKVTMEPECKMDAKNLGICWSSNIIHQGRKLTSRRRKQDSMLRETGSYNLLTAWLIQEIKKLNLNSD